MSKEFKRNILVTGGAGFIGSHLVQHLTYAGHKVTSVDIKPKTVSICEHVISDVGSYINSLMVCEEMPRLFPNTDEYDYIFHLAATPRAGVSIQYPENVISNNMNSLLSVLQYCRFHSNTKLIFVSSSSVVWADVHTNPYALTKMMGEELVKTYIETFNLEASIVRLFSVYGPQESEYGKDSTLIRQIKSSVLQNKPFALMSLGEQSRDFTHVSDVVLGLESVMFEMESDWLPIYELGSGGGITKVKDIIDKVLEHKPDFQILNFPARPQDPPKTIADRKKKPAGWNPKIKVIDYIDQWFNAGCPKD